MSVIAGKKLQELVEKGVITGVKPEQINAASIDITLGNLIKTEVKQAGANLKTISLAKREPLELEEKDITDSSYTLSPNQFVLAASVELFNLPDTISAEYKLKSSMARIGLEHLNAGWCDAGWNNSTLTLELKNVSQFHNIVLDAGTAIGQVIFYEHDKVPSGQSYATKGSYNDQSAPTSSQQKPTAGATAGATAKPPLTRAESKGK